MGQGRGCGEGREASSATLMQNGLRRLSFGTRGRSMAAMAITVLRRIHNPRGRVCGCDPDCWCKRTVLGRAVRWWFPGRWFGIHHKNAELEALKRSGVDLAQWKRDQQT